MSEASAKAKERFHRAIVARAPDKPAHRRGRTRTRTWTDTALPLVAFLIPIWRRSRERGEIESPLPARYEHASDGATGMAIRLDGAGARLASRCCSPISSEYILSLGNHETAHRTLGENFPPPPPLPGYWGRREGSRERGREAEKLRRCLRTCSGFRYAISS